MCCRKTTIMSLVLKAAIFEGWHVFTERIVRYFFFFFLSLTHYFFFFFFVLDLPASLEPESRALPPCCASRSEEGRPQPAAGLTGAPRAEVEEGVGWEAGGRDEGGECVPLEAETWRGREKWCKEAADDSVRGAQAAAVKDTTLEILRDPVSKWGVNMPIYKLAHLCSYN